jgi:aminopeptidase-like protein
MHTTQNKINQFLKDLFPIHRSLAGSENRATLRYIKKFIPIKILEIPTNKKVFDWKVPYEWSVKEGIIKDKNNKELINLKNNNLHVMSYSKSVNLRLSWRKLKEKLHTHTKLKKAIPYRTSYYKKDWGFCVNSTQYNKIKSSKGPYQIKIDSNFKKGFMSIGELLIKGKSKKEILISTYICHPSMANDNLSGVIVTSFLSKYILSKKRKWSYRILFIPETIGAISYLSIKKNIMSKIDCGLNISTVGGPGQFGYKQTFEKNHYLNNMIDNVFKENKINYKKYTFDINGSDERQYSSPGFRINIGAITKDKYYEYPYYHSSLDDLNFVKSKNLKKTLDIYSLVIDKFEKREIYISNINVEAFLTKHKLFKKVGGSFLKKSVLSDVEVINWIIFLCDGKHSLDEISKATNIPLKIIKKFIKKLLHKNIISKYI